MSDSVRIIEGPIQLFSISVVDDPPLATAFPWVRAELGGRLAHLLGHLKHGTPLRSAEVPATVHVCHTCPAVWLTKEAPPA